LFKIRFTIDEHKIKAALPVIGFVAMPLEQGTAKRTNNDGSAPI